MSARVLTGCLSLYASLVAAQPIRRHALNVVIPGINTEASNDYLADAAGLNPTKDRYVVIIDDGAGDASSNDHRFTSLLRQRPSSVPEDHVIRLRPGEKLDRSATDALFKIAANPSATVLIDMAIGADASNDGVKKAIKTAHSMDQSAWHEQSVTAGLVAATLAEAHVDRYPDSRTTLFGHSAGTQAMVVAQTRDEVYQHGDGKIEPTKRALFDVNIAASPRDPDNLSRNTLMIVADGDFRRSPGGHVPLATLAGENDAQDAQAMAKKGYRVVRVTGQFVETLDSPWADIANKVAPAVGMIPALESRFHDQSEAHDAVHEFFHPDLGTISVYEKGSDTPHVMAHAPLGKVVNALVSDNASLRSPSSPSTSTGTVSLEAVANELRREEPTPGLGGISLNATADLPIDPDSVTGAMYFPTTGLVLNALGRSVPLPPMDPQALRLAYELGYLADQKPELSISEGIFEKRSSIGDGDTLIRLLTIAAPKHQPVHYFGNVAGTLLGLVMQISDTRLFSLAFGSSSTVAEVAQKVAGFHTLAESFPDKYTTAAFDSGYGGVWRVFLYSSRVTLQFNRSNNLAFTSTQFTVNVGGHGPAEAAFTSFVQQHFDEICATEFGAPFRALRSYAQAFAVMRWLREHEVTIQGTDDLLRVPRPLVLTPTGVEPVELPKPTDIDPKAPFVRFGTFGPVQIVDAEGRKTTISYRHGLAVHVRRADGGSLVIIRDALGTPLALRSTEPGAIGSHDAAIVASALIDAVRLKQQGGVWFAELTNRSFLIPLENPELAVVRIVRGFATESKSHP